MDPIADHRMSRLIELAIVEDSGLGDLTGEATLDEAAEGTASILIKEKGVVAGLEAAGMVFHLCDESLQYEYHASEGDSAEPGALLLTVHGSVRSILRAERIALNILQRMSGIATLTRQFVDAIGGTGAKITDTRKTAPGLRVFDKWAVRLGGGVNHRFGLDDMILIKDNHIVAAGGITKTIARCREYLTMKGINVPVEIETGNLAEVEEAMRSADFNRIMLDNFSPAQVKKAVKIIDHRVEVEASGGITLHNVRAYAEVGVDYISVGALTHSPRSIDISLELRPSAR